MAGEDPNPRRRPLFHKHQDTWGLSPAAGWGGCGGQGSPASGHLGRARAVPALAGVGQTPAGEALGVSAGLAHGGRGHSGQVCGQSWALSHGGSCAQAPVKSCWTRNQGFFQLRNGRLKTTLPPGSTPGHTLLG